MSAHNVIVLTAAPAGRFLEGIISGTPKPGTCMQVKAATEMIGGRHTWEVFNKAADGSNYLIAVLYNNHFMGQPITAAYETGARCFMYCPIPGDELQVLVANIGGTGDSFAIGDLLMVDDTTGKAVASTGSEARTPFIVMETVAALAADRLVHVMYTGS